MGICVSAQHYDCDRDHKAWSDAIDRQLEEDSRKFRKVCKILLLGSGASGKSTIAKQMKIIHQNGFTQDQLLTFRPTIYRNTLDSAQGIILQMRSMNVECVMSANHVLAKHILEYRVKSTPNFVFSADIAQAIHELWQDPIIPKVMDCSSEFYLMDSAVYFFTEVLRIGTPDYIPTENDVLRARAQTIGITETWFNMGPLSIHMVDVGGQRSERKKWIHCFESVTSIVFCTALSEYDQVLLEEKNQNRMQESLILFESVINSRWFLRTSIILLLNKMDVFKNKLPKIPLESYFPEYTGGADINKAAKYVLWKFMQANRACLSIHPHLTQATDTTNIRLVFSVVQETILQNALKESGIL
ncbi:heterotrimeric G protein alpha subunit [Suillus clintonianus]|uniref:heterotrimeric G protein alpha subunit n=1 Tax=Suillus clintonianus TaxID=1904413 RepID=UPI001B866639|nr:heterotrimeric G protein alpha subunit [Suillus clintonianus]KAG2138033.1 heterotrimeric G protein alpha subunit [Suillus clintonianus]